MAAAAVLVFVHRPLITLPTDRDTAEMVRRIKGYRLLTGYRGHTPADLDALEETLLRVSRLVEEIPEISELDLNPIFALPVGQGCRTVHARIRVQPLSPCIRDAMSIPITRHALAHIVAGLQCFSGQVFTLLRK